MKKYPTIRNKSDLKWAYTELQNIVAWALTPEYVKMVKAAIRAYRDKMDDPENNDRWIVRANDTGDSATILIRLPEEIETKEEADEYFKGYEYCEYYPSEYDCTGQTFTVSYKLFMRHGCWHAYHHVAMDV